MPQLLDLALSRNKNTQYQDFYRSLQPTVSVLDLTDRFLELDYRQLYINDQYGGHLSVAGNQLVAREVSAWLRSAGVRP
jgi:hypothetical protein